MAQSVAQQMLTASPRDGLNPNASSRRARWTCAACRSGPAPSRGESVSVTDLLADSGPHGLGHAGRPHRAGQRGLRPAAVQRRELHGRVHDGRGRLGRSLLRSAHSHRRRRRSHAVVHRGRVRQLAEHHRRGQRGPVELRHRNHTINNTANAGNFTTVGDVSTGTLTASGAATARSRAPR